ncbi:hypothetical protein TPY_2670 [Sulfobacillus acidophilus TPY]|uniref:Uncharacterized protein n=1 Tax=Sulfobacillus acidophilus (strain ATCC 700253 / DSM 10332 / NAL) TaxID=679936 RepID=G8TV71_SULAD|nr:hypothetical protein TPY_2670 [Sulfobacillus acidophilus TPY]AEW04711.1 hypothetical protein Sulac_1211 [Sulfobacillus acidophilus DSM 10332]
MSDLIWRITPPIYRPADHLFATPEQAWHAAKLTGTWPARLELPTNLGLADPQQSQQWLAVLQTFHENGTEIWVGSQKWEPGTTITAPWPDGDPMTWSADLVPDAWDAESGCLVAAAGRVWWERQDPPTGSWVIGVIIDADDAPHDPHRIGQALAQITPTPHVRVHEDAQTWWVAWPSRPDAKGADWVRAVWHNLGEIRAGYALVTNAADWESRYQRARRLVSTHPTARIAPATNPDALPAVDWTQPLAVPRETVSIKTEKPSAPTTTVITVDSDPDMWPDAMKALTQDAETGAWLATVVERWWAARNAQSGPWWGILLQRSDLHQPWPDAWRQYTGARFLLTPMRLVVVGQGTMTSPEAQTLWRAARHAPECQRSYATWLTAAEWRTGWETLHAEIEEAPSAATAPPVAPEPPFTGEGRADEESPAPMEHVAPPMTDLPAADASPEANSAEAIPGAVETEAVATSGPTAAIAPDEQTAQSSPSAAGTEDAAVNSVADPSKITRLWRRLWRPSASEPTTSGPVMQRPRQIYPWRTGQPVQWDDAPIDPRLPSIFDIASPRPVEPAPAPPPSAEESQRSRRIVGSPPSEPATEAAPASEDYRSTDAEGSESPAAAPTSTGPAARRVSRQGRRFRVHPAEPTSDPSGGTAGPLVLPATGSSQPDPQPAIPPAEVVHPLDTPKSVPVAPPDGEPMRTVRRVKPTPQWDTPMDAPTVQGVMAGPTHRALTPPFVAWVWGMERHVGTTTAAVALAHWFAWWQETPVLLLDGHWMAPGVSRVLRRHVLPGLGWEATLRAARPWESPPQVVQISDRLTAWVIGPGVAWTAPLLSFWPKLLSRLPASVVVVDGGLQPPPQPVQWKGIVTMNPAHLGIVPSQTWILSRMQRVQGSRVIVLPSEPLGDEGVGSDAWRTAWDDVGQWIAGQLMEDQRVQKGR